MRIIAGEFRGRKLLAPTTGATRPITDRVKQSLFDILNPYLDEAVVYDCFAGTGSLGLEALSRGARQVTLWERDRAAFAQLSKNVDTLACHDRCKIVASDVFKWTAANPKASQPVDVVFLDPPYRFVVEQQQPLRDLVDALRLGHLAEDGFIVFRHEAGIGMTFANCEEFDRRTYGKMDLVFLRSLEAS